MRHLLFVAVLAVLTNAQTFTSPDINGNTVVEVITTDALGNPSTTIMSTIGVVATPAVATTTNLVTTTSPTTSSTTITTTAVDQEMGPVGQPTATIFTPGGPTPFTYTTIIGGVTSVILDTFEPTKPASLRPSIGSSGTLWDFSSWQAIYAPPTTTASAGANGAVGGPLTSSVISTLVFGFAVGVGLVLY